MNALTGVVLGSVTVIVTASVDTLDAEETSATLSPEALREIVEVEAEIDRIEAQTLERLVTAEQ
jgi:uncharacterized protein Yka (UPF0111/DUF47 family)